MSRSSPASSAAGRRAKRTTFASPNHVRSAARSAMPSALELDEERKGAPRRAAKPCCSPAKWGAVLRRGGGLPGGNQELVAAQIPKMRVPVR
jgi:hypothetical protein